MLAPFGRVSSDDLAEQTVRVVQQGQLTLLELLEELVPGDFHQVSMLRLRRLREHDADDADIVSSVRAIDGCWLCAVLFGPCANGLVVGNNLGHGDLLRCLRSQWSIANGVPEANAGERNVSLVRSA